MPAYVSPGVYVIEKDWSDYSPSLNATNVGVMGFASQGIVGKATLVTNADQLISEFGRPDDAEGGFGLIGAYHILDRTNTVYFTRVATDSAAVAQAVNEIGTQPRCEVSSVAVGSHHLFMVATKGSSGAVTTTDQLIFNVTPASANAATPGGADAVALEVNRRTTTDSPVSFNKQTSSTGDWVGAAAGSKAEVQVWGWSSVTAFPTIPIGTVAGAGGDISSLSGSNAALSALSGNMLIVPHNGVAALGAGIIGGAGSGLTMSATVSGGGAYVTRTLYPGAGYNYSSTVETYGPKITGLQAKWSSKQGATSVFQLTKGGGTEESAEVQMVSNTTGTNMDPEKVINNTADETNKTSDYIIGEFAVDNVDRDDVAWSLPTSWGGAMNGAGSGVWLTASGDGAYINLPYTSTKYLKLLNADSGRENDFTGGNNGDLSGSKSFSNADVKAAVIGNAVDGNGVYSYLKEDVDISILAIPGCTEQSIVNNSISIAQDSQEFLFVTMPPVGIDSPQNAIAWSNGVAEGRTAALNSSYACVYWPWVKLYNPFTQVDEYISPDIFAVRQMAFTDSTFDAWFAPAGLVRGRLTKPVDVEVVLTQGDRDALYGPGNIINPVQKFLTEGIVLWGQRTAQRTATALDRINVRRLMIIIRKMLLASTRQFVFEPNDAATWKRITNAVEPMMADIKSRRGVTDFKVICDSTTNTPIRIDRSELWCKVILQPTKAAEVIVFELNLTSATLGLNLPTA
jgi:phage tail sheath protein FI